MAQGLFISEQWLKENTVVDENVDPKLIRPGIFEAQEIEIHPILGTKLYEKLKTDIEGSTLTGDYLTLVNSYIAPTLKYYTLVELTPEMLVKYMNKAVVKKNSENSTPIDTSEMSWQMKRWKDKAQWYGQRLIGYLCENSELFPEYKNPSTTQDSIGPERNTVYSDGMFLGTENYDGDDGQRSSIDDPETST